MSLAQRFDEWAKQHEQRGLDYTEHAELSYPEFQRDVTFETDGMTKRH